MKKEEFSGLFFSRTHDYLNVYLPKHKDGSDYTKRTYRIAMKEFKDYTNNVKGIPTRKFLFADCTYDYLLDYRNYLHDTMHRKESTVNTKLAAIKSYVGYASSRDTSLLQIHLSIERVPLYVKPKMQQPIIDDVNSLGAILSMPKNTRKGMRDTVMMSMLYDSGMRISEMKGLLLRDVEVSENQTRVLIHGKGQKERIVYLDEKTTALVRQYLEEYHPDRRLSLPFFYTESHGQRHPMSVRNYEKLIKKYADKARADNHPLPDSVSPHTFRRTRGTNLYRDGVDISVVSGLLGHANIQTTKDYYTSPSMEQLQAVAKKRTEMIPDEIQMWPDDEEELAKELGLK